VQLQVSTTFGGNMKLRLGLNLNSKIYRQFIGFKTQLSAYSPTQDLNLTNELRKIALPCRNREGLTISLNLYNSE